MKDLLNRRINNIQSLEDRKIFRDIISQVFGELVDYQDRQIETIRRDFFDEMTVDHTRPVICGTIMKQYEYDVTDRFMFPMSMEDVNGTIPQVEDICKSFQEGKPYMIGKTFLKCDFKALDELYSSNRRFCGKIYTDKGVVDIRVRIARYDSYKDIVAHLYNVFVKNGLEWTTPNLPYIHKFVTFMIDTPISISEDALVERIVVDMEEYEKYRVDDVFPVWNLEYTHVQSINFPIPAFDNVLNEHRFDVYDLPSYCYIPDFMDEYNGYVKRQAEHVSVIIPENEISEWPMYKLHPATDGKNYVYEHKIFDNGPSDNFSNGYLNERCKAIRTKGEMMRVLSSFKASDMFKIYGCEVANSAILDKSSTYAVNDGIFDEIRAADIVDKVLVVYYDYKYEKDYLASDIISFIVSELQQYIPDMRCIGVVRREVE
ncbi:MAG: hypothetical protein IJF37_10430 [Lachnospiraceae bacterium]|nr:hypothetical protein [Lachnospiraceae bacterium]